MIIKHYAADDDQPGDGVLTFRPALRCASLIAIRTHCTNEATAGSVARMRDGSYVLQPMCRQCAEATARVYAREARK